MRAARWVVVVLAACGGDDAPARVDAPTVEDDAPGAVPMIGDALAGMCGAYTPPSAIAAGDDLLRVEIDDPLAVCNDGTRAVMYVRPSTGGANANR